MGVPRTLTPMATSDFALAKLDSMIDLRHSLAVLALRMPWAQIESHLTPLFAHRDRAGRSVEGMDLFGPTVAPADVGVSPAGRSRLPIRMMVALLYRKHAYGLSDDGVIERWAQDVYFQLFSGQGYFEARFPCDKAQLSRFRKGLGKAGVKELLKTTIEASVAMGAVKKADIQRVIDCRHHGAREGDRPSSRLLKADHGMNRCWLKAPEGNALHTLLCAAGFNLRWLLRAVAGLGLGFVLLVLTAWMRATRVLLDAHQHISGSGKRIFLTGGHQVPAGAAG
jgi:hypothetical protein